MNEWKNERTNERTSDLKYESTVNDAPGASEATMNRYRTTVKIVHTLKHTHLHVCSYVIMEQRSLM